VTSDGFMGPPWQMDWTLKAQAARDTLPEQVRKMVDVARAELVTAKDPYFRGIDADADLPAGMNVRPLRSTDLKGRRMEDPQIVVDEVFWQ
jgi:hypothetical protein